MRGSRARRAVLGVVGGALLAGSTWAAPASASGGGGCGRAVTDATGTQVRIKNFCFTPTVLHVRPGQSVTFTNLDTFPHTVQGSNVVWGSWDALRFHKSVTYKFLRSGAYPFVCTIHPGMVGAIVVGDGSGSGAAKTTTTEKGPVVRVPSGRVALAGASLGSNGPWPVTTFVGFGLFAACAVALVLARRRSKVGH